jgi:hypothetical protein
VDLVNNGDDEAFRCSWPGQLSIEDILFWDSMVVQRSLLNHVAVEHSTEECCLIDLLNRGTIKSHSDLDHLSYMLVASNQYATAVGDCLLATWRAEKLRVSICIVLRFS